MMLIVIDRTPGVYKVAERLSEVKNRDALQVALTSGNLT
jgi:hypothetical protein